MPFSKTARGALSLLVVFSIWILTAPSGSGGSVSEKEGTPSVTFFVA